MSTTLRPVAFSVVMFAVIAARGQSLAVDGLSGPVTQHEINSFINYLAAQSPPPTPWGNLNGTGHNDWADGYGGRDLEAMGEMFIVSSNLALLNNMVSWADQCVSERNDLMSATNGGQRVMWTGLIDKVWCPNWPTDDTDDQSQYCGCETEDVIGHLAFCAKLILQSPGIWNETVPDGDPFGYGTTYLQRATNYLGKCDEANDEYFLKWFIQPGTSLIVAPTNAAWVALNENVDANNRQMMFTSGFQRLAEAHQLLGDNPARVAQYNAIVQATVNLCLTGMVNFDPKTVNGQRIYDWGYYPTNDAPEATEIHAEYDILGVWRAFNHPSYGFILPPLIPFANTMADVIYLGTNTFAANVDGSGGPQSPIYSGWLFSADWNSQVYNIVAGAAYTNGWYKDSADIDAAILFMKNRRYLEYSVTPAPTWQVVQAGNQAAFMLALAPMGGFTNTVNLSVAGLPPGATAGFNPASINCGQMSLSSSNSTLAIQTSGSTPDGAYTVSIISAGGSVSHTNLVNVVVGSYSLSASPSSQSVSPGGDTTYEIEVATNSDFAGNVSLGVSGLPANCSAVLSPASISAAGMVSLTVVASNTAAIGNDTLTIYGTNGTIVCSVTAGLDIVGGGTSIWDGGSGTDSDWTDSANWDGRLPPPASHLIFGGNTRLINTNDTSSETLYSNIVFDAGAGAFVLNGNSITLVGGITNDSPNIQTIDLGLDFNTNVTLSGVNDSVIVLGGLTNTLASGATTITLGGTGELSDLWKDSSSPGGTNTILLNDSTADWTIIHNPASTGAAVPWLFEVNAGTLNFGCESNAPVVTGATTHNNPEDVEIGNTVGTAATFNMVNGALSIAAPLDTGTALNSTGVVNQTGGTLTINGSPYYFQGANGASTGELSVVNISGGTIDMGPAAAPAGPFYVASRGTGFLSISGTGALNCGILDISRNAAGNTFGSIGVVNLNGGTLTASRIGTATENQQAGPASDGISPSATFNFNGGILRAAGSSAAFFQGSTASPAIPITAIVAAGGAFIDSSNFSITILEPLQHDATLGTQPDGGLTKLGSGTVQLTAANTYTGATAVSAGTLALTGAASIADTAGISISNGATFDGGDLAGGEFTLAVGQTLTGEGTVKGNLTVSRGATLAPGGSLSTLTFSNDLVLDAGSTTILEVNHLPLTNDTAVVAGNLTYGGTLLVTNLGAPPLSAGDSFKLFRAAAYSGMFSNISPGVPGTNLAWDTNDLTNGVLAVVAQIIVPAVPPKITSFSVADGNVTVSGTNSQADATYYLLTTTNLSLPISQWTAVSTNVATGNNFMFTGRNTIKPGTPQQFYILSSTN